LESSAITALAFPIFLGMMQMIMVSILIKDIDIGGWATFKTKWFWLNINETDKIPIYQG